MKGKVIVILALFLSSATYAQTKRVSGIVKDGDGFGLPNVAVVVKGTTNGVQTDANGEFQIEVSSRDTLEFSFVGMKTMSQVVGNRNVLEVTLYEDEEMLEEVTVVAFGTQKKSSVIESIQTVNMKDLKVPASNLTTALAGRIPGIISYQTTGEPGADNANFFVRGVTTFGYKAEPLILIDGFEATSNDLARIQPDDVESFSILKDAAATVMYGARGANGIIMVVTKTGREGPARINARVDYNISMPTKMNKTVDGVTYMRMYNEARVSRYPILGAYYSEQKIQATEQGIDPMIYPNVDWYDELFRPATYNTKANFNISGGGQVASYYVSGGFDRETGLLKVDSRNNFNNNIDIKRYHVRSNVIFKLTSTTTLDTRLQGRFERYTGPYEATKDIFYAVMNSNPVDFPAVYDPDPAHEFTQNILFGSTFVGGNIKVNPYAMMIRGYEDRNESTITAMATLNQDLKFITEGLKFQAKISTNTWGKYSSRRSYLPFYYDLESYNQITGEYTLFDMNPYSGQNYLGDVEPGRDASGDTYLEARLNWDRRFGKHTIGLMTVGMMQENLITGGNNTSIYETLPERNMGNSGRLAYDYDSRYYFEFVYGYNGSEKFSGEKKYGFFPSVVGGWFLSNEPFYKPVKKYISSLKLKASWGLVGNDAISGRSGRFFYLSDISIPSDATVTENGYRWGQTFMNAYPGYVVRRYANPDITWEVSEKINLGLEVGLMDDALKMQIDAFRDIRSKIYMERQNFPSTSGLEAAISGNVGKVESRGIDAQADYQHFFTKDFWLTGRFNFTYSTNKYLELDEKDYPDEYLKHKGHNINQWWGLVAERLFVDEEEIRNSPKQDFGLYQAGDIKYKDINGDGVINSNDQVPLGYPTVPEIQYGFGLSAGYKKLDFSFFFQGNARVSFFINPGVGGGDDGTEGIAPLVNRRNALSIVAEDYWSETNPNIHAFWPRLSTEPLENNIQQSSWWLRDGSFLRLSSVEIGYTLPVYKKIGMQSCRIYANAEKPLVFSKFKMWDPEMGRNGLGYPLNKRFNIGIQIGF